jgi:(1->4)-alpha-D-glucan 1-alpha-D-glucosylmutase
MPRTPLIPPRTPIATYRLQFGDGFGFADASRLLPHLADLGISDLYASPLFAAVPGTSGYHVTDPTRLEPSLGTRGDFDALTDELRDRGMGLLLDIVPNHMSASGGNRWWTDVLRRGRGSEFTSYFDVDWSRHGGRVFLPVLGKPLGEVLRDGELTLDADADEPVLRYHEHAFPVRPGTAGGARDVGEILDAQSYLLGYWRDGPTEVNYRRFFDIDELVALRQEDPVVFEATHGFVVDLVREGRVQGLRVDHVDGLRDPAAYLRKLRRAVGRSIPIHVEKILGPGESVPADWPVEGTTGYEFATAVIDALVDRQGSGALERFTARFTGRREPFEEVAIDKKRLVMQELFPGEVEALTGQLAAALGSRAPDRDALRSALMEVTAQLPVYRTYTRGRTVSSSDRRVVSRATRAAKRRLSDDSTARRAVDTLRSVLLLDAGGRRGLEFVLRWQQLTGPVAAKGVEDTALYDFPAFIPRSDVGADPGSTPGGPVAFHRACRIRARVAPRAMTTTSTHDSKRSEDVRALLAPISEVVPAWERGVRRWSRVAEGWKRGVDGVPVPDPSEELLIYQTLLGVLPLDEGDDAAAAITERLEGFARKAAREAKTHSSWVEPNEPYEEALLAFIRSLTGPEGSAMRDDLRRFRGRIEIAGATNALTQILLEVAAPGIPDFYQGTERWFQRLVDPDNRDAISSETVSETVAPHGITELLATWRDGRIKHELTREALAVRASDPELFTEGAHLPLEVTGERTGHVIAFARRLDRRWALAVTPRLVVPLTRGGRFPLGRRVWRDTTVRLPRRAPEAWRDAMTRTRHVAENGALPVGEILADLPFALLVPL